MPKSGLSHSRLIIATTTLIIIAMWTAMGIIVNNSPYENVARRAEDRVDPELYSAISFHGKARAWILVVLDHFKREEGRIPKDVYDMIMRHKGPAYLVYDVDEFNAKVPWHLRKLPELYVFTIEVDERALNILKEAEGIRGLALYRELSLDFISRVAGIDKALIGPVFHKGVVELILLIREYAPEYSIVVEISTWGKGSPVTVLRRFVDRGVVKIQWVIRDPSDPEMPVLPGGSFVTMNIKADFEFLKELMKELIRSFGTEGWGIKPLIAFKATFSLP